MLWPFLETITNMFLDVLCAPYLCYVFYYNSVNRYNYHFPFYSWTNWGIERLVQVTESVRGRHMNVSINVCNPAWESAFPTNLCDSAPYVALDPYFLPVTSFSPMDFNIVYIPATFTLAQMAPLSSRLISLNHPQDLLMGVLKLTLPKLNLWSVSMTPLPNPFVPPSPLSAVGSGVLMCRNGRWITWIR